MRVYSKYTLMKSTIKLSDETKNVLKERKKDSRESYEDVIKRLLSESEPPSFSEMLMEAYHYLENRGVKNVQVSVQDSEARRLRRAISTS